MAKSVIYKETDVFYSQQGRGQTVVLLHGFLEERSMWDRIAKRLEKDFNVICIDLLGHGETGCIGYVHSMEDHAEAIQQILKKEQINSCIVLGHSMGGYIALAFAEEFPALVNGLVLFHSSALPDSAAKKKERERIIKIVQHDQSIFIRTAIPSLFPENTIAKYKNEIDATIEMAEGFPKQGIIANVRGIMERKDRTEVLKNGNFKKMMIHGTEDPIISNETVELQAGSSPEIRLEILDGIGHMGHIEAPLQCERIIADFCADVFGQ